MLPGDFQPGVSHSSPVMKVYIRYRNFFYASKETDYTTSCPIVKLNAKHSDMRKHLKPTRREIDPDRDLSQAQKNLHDDEDSREKKAIR